MVLPVMLILLFGIWEVGRIVQVNQILYNAAREAARLAAGGSNAGTSVTAAMVQQACKDYMTSAGLPTAAVSNSQVTLTCLATPSWTDPYNAAAFGQVSGHRHDSLRHGVQQPAVVDGDPVDKRDPIVGDRELAIAQRLAGDRQHHAPILSGARRGESRRVVALSSDSDEYHAKTN